MEKSKVSKKRFILLGLGITAVYFIVRWFTPLGELPFWEDMLWALLLGVFTGLIFGVAVKMWRKSRSRGANA